MNNKTRDKRISDADELSFRAALEAVVAAGAGGKELARIVADSPFIEKLVAQFAVRKWAGPLFNYYGHAVLEWRAVTLEIVWTNASANGGRLVRKSLQARNFGAFWNHIVRLKCLTARGRVYRDINSREQNRGEFPELPGPASDDPSLEAELNELRARLGDAATSLPTDLHRLILHHLIDETYDLKKIAVLAGCDIETVRRAISELVALLRRIFGLE